MTQKLFEECITHNKFLPSFNKHPRVQQCVPNFAKIEKSDCEKKIVKVFESCFDEISD